MKRYQEKHIISKNIIELGPSHLDDHLFGNYLIDIKGRITGHMLPSEIDLGKVICPSCGFKTSGYFIDSSSSNYRFFCSCCSHEWEC